MTRMAMTGLGMGKLAGAMAVVSALSLAACGTSSVGGGGGTTGAAAGTPCNPVSTNQGCFNGVRMQCTTDSASALGGKWSLAGPCATGQVCVEAADPADPNKHIAECKASTGGGGGSDATAGSDTTTGGGDGSSGVDVSIIGGDDASGGGKDTGGGVVGSCGDGFCNTGETAANCPADCGTANNCGNGTCDAGETTKNCPADCPAANKCGNGTCDAGETNATCPADCPTGGGGGTTDPTACLQANCSAEYNACGSDQKCVNLINCLGQCTGASDTACINACANTAGQTAITEYTNLGDCGTTNNCFAGAGGGGGGGTTGHICDTNCGSANKVGGGCYCDNQCAKYGDCCDAAGSAPNAQSPNTTCAGSTCADCNGGGGGGGGTTPVCGNGTCETGETAASCPADCGGGTTTCTTFADVKSIFSASCSGGGCHSFQNKCPGTTGKYSYSGINNAVQSGVMPPGGSLSAADKAKLAAWAASKGACAAANCP